MLNIGQFLDEGANVGQCMPWLLGYAQALQCVGEATEARRWHPIGIHFTPEVFPLVDAFIVETKVELMEIGITTCWSEASVVAIPPQKQDGPLTDIIAFLDELAQHVLSCTAWDGLVYCHRDQCTLDPSSTFLSFWFHITKASGEFVGVARGILFSLHMTPCIMLPNGSPCMGW